jgi:hypothetical protein
MSVFVLARQYKVGYSRRKGGDKTVQHKDQYGKILLKASIALLPLCVGVLAVLITLLLVTDIPFPRFSVSLFSVFFGALFWLAALYFKTLYRFYFSSVFLLQTGCLLLLHDAGLGFLPYKALWPFFMIFIAVSFVVSGYIRYRRGKPSYIVPAAGFLVLGVVFLLFSADIITLSFISCVLFVFPLVCVPLGVTGLYWFVRTRIAAGAPDAV